MVNFIINGVLLMKMQLQCKNKKCNYVWDYKGKSNFYACCPNCMNKVRIDSVPEDLLNDINTETNVIEIKVTQSLIEWIKKNDYSAPLIFYEAVKELGYEEKE